MPDHIKLIIVDDEKDIRLGLSNYFPWNEMGYEVIGSFDNGLSALSFLETNNCNVVLTDIKMKDFSGIDLAKEIHKRFPSIIVVFISGYADFEYARKAIEYGVRFYIVKPTVYEEIHDIFMTIKEELQNKKGKDIDYDMLETLGYNEQILFKVEKYIEDNLKVVSLESAAKAVSLSPHYLSVFFKNNKGIKFIDYVRDVKMRKAKELLQDSSLRIYEISNLLGYLNSNNFTRVFTQYYGFSPRQYRMLSSGLNEGEDD